MMLSACSPRLAQLMSREWCHPSTIKTIARRCDCDQTDLDNPSAETTSCQVTLGCVKMKIKANQTQEEEEEE